MFKKSKGGLEMKEIQPQKIPIVEAYDIPSVNAIHNVTSDDDDDDDDDDNNDNEDYIKTIVSFVMNLIEYYNNNMTIKDLKSLDLLNKLLNEVIYTPEYNNIIVNPAARIELKNKTTKIELNAIVVKNTIKHKNMLELAPIDYVIVGCKCLIYGEMLNNREKPKNSKILSLINTLKKRIMDDISGNTYKNTQTMTTSEPGNTYIVHYRFSNRHEYADKSEDEDNGDQEDEQEDEDEDEEENLSENEKHTLVKNQKNESNNTKYINFEPKNENFEVNKTKYVDFTTKNASNNPVSLDKSETKSNGNKTNNVGVAKLENFVNNWF